MRHTALLNFPINYGKIVQLVIRCYCSEKKQTNMQHILPDTTYMCENTLPYWPLAPHRRCWILCVRCAFATRIKQRLISECVASFQAPGCPARAAKAKKGGVQAKRMRSTFVALVGRDYLLGSLRQSRRGLQVCRGGSRPLRFGRKEVPLLVWQCVV